MRQQEHNYEIYEHERGFSISPKDETKPIVYATLNKYGYWRIRVSDKSEKYNSKHLMFNFYELLRTCVEILYHDWKPPVEHRHEDLEKLRYVDIFSEKKDEPKRKLTDKERKILNKSDFMQNWVKITTKKTLARKVRDYWKSSITRLEEKDPDLVQLHRKMFSTSCGRGDYSDLVYVIKNRDKKEFEYFIKDLINYQGARVALMQVHREHRDHIVKDWRVYYAHNIKPYRSLNKTLMNLPGGVTYFFPTYLAYIQLPEPATTRMKLFAYSHIGMEAHSGKGYINEKLMVVMRSNDEVIRSAVQYVWDNMEREFLHIKKTFRSTRAIHAALHYMFDYPDPVGEWDILGLAKRSIEVHHENPAQRIARAARRAEQEKTIKDSKTALPPIPLPEEEEIKFLDSYAEVRMESEEMNHCVWSYAHGAVMGQHYLFHVEKNGEKATVQVSTMGNVIQSRGPYNENNSAAVYGEKVLSQWGKELDYRTRPILRLFEDVEENKKILSYSQNHVLREQALDERPF